jgi:hypothetical protein
MSPTALKDEPTWFQDKYFPYSSTISSLHQSNLHSSREFYKDSKEPNWLESTVSLHGPWLNLSGSRENLCAPE